LTFVAALLLGQVGPTTVKVDSLVFIQVDGSADRPDPAQVEQAHQLLRGEWEIVSYIDDGETLGPRLVGAKLAKGGRVRIDERAFRVTNPETNETRVIPFRVNPARQPRQINVTTRDDRVIGGIYRFDGDNLTICMEMIPDSGYPTEFEAPAGSRRLLITLHMVDHVPSLEPTPATESAADPGTVAAAATLPTTPTPAEHAVHATATAARRPTESELARVRDLFAGNWLITSIQDNGEKLGAELIRQRFAEDGRIRFGTRSFEIINPRTETRKINSYRVDPTKTPSEIDVTTLFDSVLKGIYHFQGDNLLICLNKSEDDPRPEQFEAPAGSDRMLIHLTLSTEDPPARPVQNASTRSQTKEIKEAEDAPQPAPTPTRTESINAQVLRLIPGSWTTTDNRGTLTVVFQPDGSFVATRNWGRGERRLFGPPSDTSNGSWFYRDGNLAAGVTLTTDRRVAGHQFNGRVRSIGEDTMVVSDNLGALKTFRRLR